MQEPVVMGKSAQFNPESVKKYHDGFVSLNGMLGEHTYAAGNHLTIADFALVASVASSHVRCLWLKYPVTNVYFETDRRLTRKYSTNIQTSKPGSRNVNKRLITTRS